jgi:hypothetical protein
MRQKTKKYQNQESTDKKINLFFQSISHLPRWVHLVQKTRAKNSHAWAPLKGTVYSSLCVNYDRNELVVKNLVGLGNIAWMDLPYLFVWESGDGVRDYGGRGQGTVPSSSK